MLCRDVSGWIVRVYQDQESDRIVHLGADILDVYLPTILGIQLVFDGLCTIHLRICHVWGVVRAWCQYSITRLKKCSEDNLQCLGNPMCHVYIVF